MADEVLAQGQLEEGEVAEGMLAQLEEGVRRRRVERVEPGQPVGPNIQSWLLTIGTHKKPTDEREWDLLRESLAQAKPF